MGRGALQARHVCAVLVLLPFVAMLDVVGTEGAQGTASRACGVPRGCSTGRVPLLPPPSASPWAPGRVAALRGGACYSSATEEVTEEGDDDGGDTGDDDAPLRSDWERRILVTGGCGFMGSHLVDRLVSRYEDYLIVVLDVLDECGSLEHLRGALDQPNCAFVRGDVSFSFPARPREQRVAADLPAPSPCV